MDIKQKLLGDPVSEQYGTNEDSGATPGSNIAYRRLKNEHPGTSAPTIQVETQSTHSTIRSPNPESSLNRAQQEQNATPVDPVKTKRVLLGIKGFIGVVFLFVVLVSSVLSKLTLFSLADRLRNATYYPNASKKDVTEQERTTAVTLYWYLQFVLLIPNFVTLVRCLAFGVVGKTTRTYPWPRARAILMGIAGSVIEVVVMTTFVYLVLPEISPGAGILLLCGVFSFQIIVDFCYTQKWFWCQHDGCYCAQQGHDFSRLHRRSKVEYVVCIVQLILENRVMKILALVLQITGIFGFIAVWVTHMKHRGYNIIRPMVGYPLGIIILSVLWSTWFQEKIATPHGNEPQNSRARYKSSFINSGVRLLLYPFISYIVFRYLSEHNIDPWCLNSGCHITLRSDDLSILIVQVVVTFFGYLIGWVACTMILSRLSLALPLLLSTPVTVIWYYLSTYSFKLENRVFPSFTIESDYENPVRKIDKYFLMCILTSFLWFGELIAMGYFLLVKTNIILSRDSEMFLTPHYDGIFFEQHMILNRQTKKKSIYEDLSQEAGMGEIIRRNPRKIFVCSTMYRENETEMKQMLSSIYNLACHYSASAIEGGARDKYESHIFFDGATNGTQIQEFGLQLLSLLEETLHVNLKRCKREKTPYGYRLTWDIGMGDMPFTIHFKDKSFVKPKKRWSQVMYMNYVLNYRMQTDNINPSDTFILTTDADIDFTPLSADVLLDMLASNVQVGAVCARTHPKGSGVIYWYQIFDYAIGHWFQKPAEHILGCVLCSPGCFSVFRCSALKDVLDTYSTEAIGAMEFLMKDMGEDRWLCTLLIKAGWRLEYCAISEDQTYCPMEFDEFFKQRRRWIPSTIANLAQLISEAGSITRRNDTVSILFIIFQAIMVFSTAISPATVILVISSGLQSAFKLTLSDTLMIIAVLVIVSVFYGIVCLLSSPQTQLDMAKLLTFIFAIIMSVVIVGIFKDTVYSIYHGHQPAVLNSPSCNSTLNSSADAKAVEDCEKAARYIEELSRSLWKKKFILPVSSSTIYLGGFIVTFLVAAILHLPEWYCLLHGVWYLLALPSGYLLLIIYSAANLDSQSWGTREGSSGKDKGLLGWWDHLKDCFRKCVACCIWCCRREPREKEATQEEDLPKSEQEQKIEVVPTYHSRSPSPLSQEETVDSEEELQQLDEDLHQMNREFKQLEEQHKRLKLERRQLKKRLKKLLCNECEQSEGHEWSEEEREQLIEQIEQDIKQKKEELKPLGEMLEKKKKPLKWKETLKWLRDEQKCLEYKDNFKKHGYVNLHFIAAMGLEDFEAIGIEKRGFRLRLQKAAKRLPSLPIYTDVPKDVRAWLKRLQLYEYTDLFEQEGYSTAEDIENLKDLKENDLRAMGISKRAHLQRLKMGIENLVKPTALELRIRGTATIIENVLYTDISSTKADEADFWKNLIDVKLKPVSVRFQGQIQDLKQSLRSLRNQTLALLFLVNILWIILLYTLEFPELEDYGLDSRGFQLLFLAVYGFIIIVQFITLLCHRIVTLVHYLGRTQPSEVIGPGNREDPILVASWELSSLYNQPA